MPTSRRSLLGALGVAAVAGCTLSPNTTTYRVEGRAVSDSLTDEFLWEPSEYYTAQEQTLLILTTQQTGIFPNRDIFSTDLRFFEHASRSLRDVLWSSTGSYKLSAIFETVPPRQLPSEADISKRWGHSVDPITPAQTHSNHRPL